MEALLSIDHTITDFLYYQSINPALQKAIYYLAAGFVYLIPVVLVVMFFRSHRDRIVATKLFIAALLAWQGFSALLGGFLYDNYGFRERPFASTGLQELFFEQPDKAFPSDHSAVIMVMIIGLFAYRYPKLGWLFLILGIFSSLARVVLGFHWFGDIVGGWLLGALALGVIWLFNRPVTRATEWLFQKFSRDYGKRY